jgi:hypothetical protein
MRDAERRVLGPRETTRRNQFREACASDQLSPYAPTAWRVGPNARGRSTLD